MGPLLPSAFADLATVALGEDADVLEAPLKLLSAASVPCLLINGERSQPTLYSDPASHIYAWEYVGAGNKATFRVLDRGLLDPYRDNEGFIAIEIRQGLPE